MAINLACSRRICRFRDCSFGSELSALMRFMGSPKIDVSSAMDFVRQNKELR